jgi:hypothetical protein
MKLELRLFAAGFLLLLVIAASCQHQAAASPLPAAAGTMAQ